MGWKYVQWINVAHYKGKWQVLCTRTVPCNAVCTLNRRGTGSATFQKLPVSIISLESPDVITSPPYGGNRPGCRNVCFNKDGDRQWHRAEFNGTVSLQTCRLTVPRQCCLRNCVTHLHSQHFG